MESISLPDDMSKVTNASHMFKNCLNLKTITCDFDFSASSALTNSTEMFFNCTSLKGGNGTVFNYSKINKEYAHVDEVGNPGYFTKSSATGIDNVQSDKVQGTKVLRDGQIYILRDGKIYNVMGMEIR